MGYEPLHTGLAVAWGIPATGLATGAGIGAVIKSWKADEMDLEITSQKELHHDPASGAVIGSTRFQGLKTLRLRYYPYGSSVAGANAATPVPDVGSEVTITDAINTDITGTYEVDQVSKPLRKDSKVFVDMTLIRHGDNANNTANRVSQTVT